MTKSTRKKILLLGAGHAQLPAIEEAKRRGYFTITTDYYQESPGHLLADKSYTVSTTDFEAVYELALSEKIDYILAYASDPAAIIAAKVAEKLGLSGNTKESIFKLTNKGSFRDLLESIGQKVPRRLVLSENEIGKVESLGLNFPLIVKPIDSSGSKGVRKIDSFNDFLEAAIFAVSFSASRYIIVEEFIDNSQGDIHGDGFVVDGKLIFCHLGDHIYGSKSNEFNPTGTKWPSQINPGLIRSFEISVQQTIAASGFKNGSINIEGRINSKGESYLMEIGPRNGGHYVPQAIYHSTGFDMVKAIFDLLEGIKIEVKNITSLPTAYYAIHSSKEGRFDSIALDPGIQLNLVSQKLYKKKGDQISPFTGSNAALGILLFQFKNMNEMDLKMSEIHNLVKLNIV